MALQHTVSMCFLSFICLFIFFIRPSNGWHNVKFSEIQVLHQFVIALTIGITVIIFVLPMPLSPYWNGSMIYRADKQQYDRMGDALLQGRLFIDNNDINPALEAMENPYDRQERDRLGIEHNWDEAYYNHHYFMYFGVVPTVILFIPFKLITGHALLSYQATQIFATLTIIGLFYFFYILCSNFFPKFPFSQYLLLSSAFSFLSIGYSIAAPALYCTAIVSGICMMVWSIICFFKGAWIDSNSKASTIYLFLGSLWGALAFGCRPPVALANIFVLAVLYRIFSNSNESDVEKIKKGIFIFSPYFVIGILLMLYNYARFDNVFEFGQSYQLTVVDQHNYGSFWQRFNLKELLIGLIGNFYAKSVFSDSFPFIRFNGAFVNFPILLLSARIFSKDISHNLSKKKLYIVSLLMFFIPFLITLFDVYWSPVLLERYRMDFYYLLCIVSYIAIAAWLEIISHKRKKILLCGLVILSFAVLVVEFLFFCIPYDGNYTFWYPEVLDVIYSGLRFGL